MDALTFLRCLPDASVDAVITDPPYGVGSLVSNRRVVSQKFDDIANNNAIDTRWLGGVYRVLKVSGAFYMFATWRNVGAWQRALSVAGFEVVNCIVWDKLAHGTGDLYKSYAPQHEFILFAVKGNHFLRGARPIDIQRFKKVPANRLIHPYEKPVDLLQYLIKKSTDRHGLVVDCFAGSGATLLAAKRTYRHFAGCDIDPHWYGVTCERLAQPFTLPLFADAPAPVAAVQAALPL